MLRRLMLFTTVVLFAGLAFAISPADVQTSIDAIVRESTPQKAKVGILVQSLEDGSVWYARSANEPFIPASTAKVVTAILALEYLDPAYRFTTRLLTDGQITDGVLTGNLYLQGGGDPTLMPEHLAAMAHALAQGDTKRGIPAVRAVHGKLIIDDTFFPRPGALLGPGWEKSDLPWYYAAPSSALSCHRNAVTVTVRGTVAGEPPVVTLAPATCLFTVENKALTDAGVKAGSVEVLPQGARLRITGRIAPGSELIERVSIAKPTALVTEVFANALRDEGILIGPTEAGRANPTTQTMLVEQKSEPLSTLLVDMLKDSDNHYAEQLRWTMLALYSLEVPLDVRFPTMLDDFARHTGLLINGIQLVDGSGLSRQNRLSPSVTVGLLTYAATMPYFPILYQSLPIAGEDGTLKNRMVGTPAAGNARGKTGTMRGVCTLAGYVTTAGNERLVYAIFLNGYESGAPAARKMQDAIVGYLAGVGQAPAPIVP